MFTAAGMLFRVLMMVALAVGMVLLRKVPQLPDYLPFGSGKKVATMNPTELRALAQRYLVIGGAGLVLGWLLGRVLFPGEELSVGKLLTVVLSLAGYVLLSVGVSLLERAKAAVQPTAGEPPTA